MDEMNEKVEGPQKQAPETPPLREVSPEELQRILEAHRKWVESKGEEGGRVDLTLANLQGANLQRANLMTANLQQADLFTASLQEAILFGATLGGAYLDGADLRDANLQEADLRDARDLTVDQVKAAKNWELAFYSKDFLKKLGLPPDHNEQVKKKLAELEKEKKGTGGK